MLAAKEIRRHGLVQCVRSMDSVPAQVSRWICAVSFSQIHKFVANYSGVPAGDFLVEVVVPADSAARLQGLRNICVE